MKQVFYIEACFVLFCNNMGIYGINVEEGSNQNECKGFLFDASSSYNNS